MAVIHITENEFEEKVLKNDKPVFVDFFATWCGPCQMMAPILEEVSNENPDVDFFAIDIDDAEETAARYGVMSIPYFAFIKNGELVSDEKGAVPKARLESKIQELI